MALPRFRAGVAPRSGALARAPVAALHHGCLLQPRARLLLGRCGGGFDCAADNTGGGIAACAGAPAIPTAFRRAPRDRDSDAQFAAGCADPRAGARSA